MTPGLYVERTLGGAIARASRQFPVVLVTGARQVGKTTLLREAGGAKRSYISLDDPLVLALAKGDPPLFLQRYRPPMFIDEIQYAPELLAHIKMEADAGRRAGMFWISGSQQFHLMKGISESLAGRVAVLNLFGMSRRELLGEANDKPFLPKPASIAKRFAKAGTLDLAGLYQRIWRGSYPALSLNAKADRDLFYGSYLQTYLQRDVRDLSEVGNQRSFIRFLKAAAARSGQLANFAEMARDADVAPNTAKRWLSILEASGLIWLLPPWHGNLTKRLVKTLKLYFMDAGLCAYLTEWSTPKTLESGAMSGAIFETWAIGEILKSFLHNGLRPPLYYYRDKDKKEIGLLIVTDGVIYPLECKKTASPRGSDVRQFHGLARKGVNMGPGGVICLAKESFPIERNIFTIPASAL